MLLLVGLGNPNPNNTNNRHNVGFLVIDGINKKFKLDDLLDLLKRNGFKCSIFRNNPTTRLSNRIGGNIYATKL